MKEGAPAPDAQGTANKPVACPPVEQPGTGGRVTPRPGRVMGW